MERLLDGYERRNSELLHTAAHNRHTSTFVTSSAAPAGVCNSVPADQRPKLAQLAQPGEGSRAAPVAAPVTAPLRQGQIQYCPVGEWMHRVLRPAVPAEVDAYAACMHKMGFEYGAALRGIAAPELEQRFGMKPGHAHLVATELGLPAAETGASGGGGAAGAGAGGAAESLLTEL